MGVSYWYILIQATCYLAMKIAHWMESVFDGLPKSES